MTAFKCAERRVTLDIATLSTAMKQSQVQQQADLSVMKSALQTAETNADQLIDMMHDSTPHPYLGNNVDIKG